ncbi:conserved hypothetical protein [Tolumonas auensis DSM 9187]|uniref:Transcriptional regulator n=1 Tax=Tolumonas auensis (strain DSM 9187 / NBRC 110442 / TA 4) TaxID=595494 RepID=C4LBB0_TOLAT|nr:hypothetical protein [Tolumonas auensis]ACQ92345.1 conserved hypothetical protein [Tolumonas auensis DSM 9187]
MSSAWLEVLRSEVKKTSLQKVADKTGLSRTLISQTCNDKYPGDLERVRQVVESVFMGAKVNCPILGEIPQHLCMAHQKKQAGELGDNPMAIKLYKACRSGCPYSQIDETELLRQPIRLHVADVGEQKAAVALYDASAVIRRLERQANSDAGTSGSVQKIMNDLLKSELDAMAVRYNRLLKQLQRDGK